MHQLSVDVYDQVAVSLVEFLKHLNYLTQRPLRTQRKISFNDVVPVVFFA